MNGELEKLLIRAHAQADYSDRPIGEFVAYVNPHEINLAYEMEYDSAQGSGTTGSRMVFKKAKPGDMTLTFFIDGTGANGVKIDAQEKVAQFQAVTSYNGDIHRTNYLIIAWGRISVRRCVLKSASIAYKLFKPNGEPLRAVITATFTDSIDDVTRLAKAQDQSPDLTHARLFKAGDSLPMMCYRIYGDPRHYLDVARSNGLDDFRNIPPGTRILFPPLSRQRSSHH